MRVLVSGYVCDAAGGSEAANTWYTCLELARAGMNVHLLTRASDRARVEAAMAGLEVPLTVTFLSDEARPSIGQLGVYARYLAFQRRVAAWATKNTGWDVGHHVSWGSINHRVGLAGVVHPLVVGPAGGGQRLEPQLAGWLDQPQRWNWYRNVAVSPSARLNPWARSIARNASKVLVANMETSQLAHRLGARNTEFMIPDGVRGLVRRPSGVPDAEVLWIGRFLPIKAAGLAVEAFRQVLREAPHARLTFVGDGPTRDLVELRAADLVAAGQVTFLGQMPWDEAQTVLSQARVHLLTSIRDSFSAQLLEAAALGIPTVGLALGGLGMLRNRPGFEVVDPRGEGDLPRALGGATARLLLADDEQWRSASSDAAALAEGNSYRAHARRFIEIYQEVTR